MGERGAFEKGLPETTHATRDSLAKTPYFPKHLLSGSDYGRDRLIRARFRLGSLGDYPCFQRRSSRVLDVPVQMLNQG